MPQFIGLETFLFLEKTKQTIDGRLQSWNSVEDYIIQWESNAEETDIGYNIIGLSLGSPWWFKDHLGLSGLQKQ